MSDLPDPIETENAVDAMERLCPSALAAYREAFDNKAINLETFAGLVIDFMKSPRADREAAEATIRKAQRPDGLESGLALEMWQKEINEVSAKIRKAHEALGVSRLNPDLRTPMFPGFTQRKALDGVTYETIGDSFKDKIIVRATHPSGSMREMEVEGKFWVANARDPRHVVPEGEKAATDDDLETLLSERSFAMYVKEYVLAKKLHHLGKKQDELAKALFFTDPEIRDFVTKQMDARAYGESRLAPTLKGLERAYELAQMRDDTTREVLHKREYEWLRRCHRRACEMMAWADEP